MSSSHPDTPWLILFHFEPVGDGGRDGQIGLVVVVVLVLAVSLVLAGVRVGNRVCLFGEQSWAVLSATVLCVCSYELGAEHNRGLTWECFHRSPTDFTCCTVSVCVGGIWFMSVFEALECRADCLLFCSS